MATSKLLKPTNVTISIPEFTDQPDQRVNSNCIDKEADAINTLSEQIGTHDVLATSDVITIGTGTSAWENKLCAIKSNGIYLVSLIRINVSNAETCVHTSVYTGDQLLVSDQNPVYFYSNEIGNSAKSVLIACQNVGGYFSYYVGGQCVVGTAPKIKIQIRKLIVP